MQLLVYIETMLAIQKILKTSMKRVPNFLARLHSVKYHQAYGSKFVIS